MGKKVPMAHETLAEIKAMCEKILAAVGKESAKSAPKPSTQQPTHDKGKL